jgi:PD-(D/E)XK nuclease superfamily
VEYVQVAFGWMIWRLTMITELTVDDLYSFKACPLHFKLKKDKIITSMNESDGLRSALETTISYFYYRLQDGYLLSMTELKEKFSSIWYGKMDIYDIKVDTNREKRAQELKAIGMLQHFHRQQKHDPDKIIAVNLDFRVPFGENFYVKGRIPIIRETPRGMEIVNYKTGHQKYDMFWQKTDMNITFQALGYQSMFKKEIDSICIQNLRAAQTVYVERKKKDYQRLYKSINMIRKSMDEGWYYPRESYMCDKCTGQSICMEWR